MYLSTDDARSDVILAAAATVFGGIAANFVRALPLYPRQGLTPLVLDVVWIFVLTGLVPLLLARYRDDRAAAFGLAPPAGGWTSGLTLVAPAVLVGGIVAGLRGFGPAEIVLGRFAFATDPAWLALTALALVALTIGALLLVSFLANRGRDAFRPTEVSLTQLLRTVGMGAAAVGLVVGGIRAVVVGGALVVLVNAVGLALLVLLADRVVPAGMSVPRATIVTPLVVVVVAHVFATGGLFRGDLARGIYAGALAAGTATVLAALTQTRARAWVAVPLVIALHWWPSCLSPLPFDLAAC